MRIVARGNVSGSAGPNRRPVEPAVRARAALGRAAAPAPVRSSGPAPQAAGDFDVAAAPAVRAAVVAQSVYHVAFRGLPEESLVHANGAYRRADEIRFRSEPWYREVA